MGGHQLYSGKPTVYRGTEFRSRLEVQWAVLLDRYDVDWVYEPYLVDLPSGEKYKPDFFLTDREMWLEVKGNICRETLVKPLALWRQVAPKGVGVAVGASNGRVMVPRLVDGRLSMAGSAIVCPSCGALWFVNPEVDTDIACPDCGADDARGAVAASRSLITAGLHSGWPGSHDFLAYRNQIR